MKKKNYFSLVAKILAIVYIIFITLFALDSKNFLEFLMHLLPTIVFIGILILSWVKPKIGGITFAVLGIGTIIVFNTYRDWASFLTISLTPIVIAIFFCFSKKK